MLKYLKEVHQNDTEIIRKRKSIYFCDTILPSGGLFNSCYMEMELSFR